MEGGTQEGREDIFALRTCANLENLMAPWVKQNRSTNPGPYPQKSSNRT